MKMIGFKDFYHIIFFINLLIYNQIYFLAININLLENNHTVTLLNVK
jgi:hypothetical protein